MSTDPLAEVLAEHPRGDWSDRTYSCEGCRNRYVEAEDARLTAFGREPTRDELIESRRGYSAVSHPGWTLDEYHAHLADVVRAYLDSDEIVERAAEAIAVFHPPTRLERSLARAALAAATEAPPTTEGEVSDG